MNEGEFNAELVKQLMQNGIYAFKVHGGMYQRAGVPDIVIQVEKGFVVWCEVKLENRELESLQKIELKRIEDSGGCAVVLRVTECTTSAGWRDLLFEDRLGNGLSMIKCFKKSELWRDFLYGLKHHAFRKNQKLSNTP